jgi:hypothetical protein
MRLGCPVPLVYQIRNGRRLAAQVPVVREGSGVTRMSQVIQNAPATPLRTVKDCNGPLWPEITSEAVCFGSGHWHPVDGCGPRQTGRIRLLISGSGVRNPDGAPQSLFPGTCRHRGVQNGGHGIAWAQSICPSKPSVFAMSR